MAYRWMLGWITAVFAFMAIGSSAFASSELIGTVQAHLYAGRTAEAISVTKVRLSEAPDDDQARFALGAVQFLQAVENLGQGLYRYGLRSGEHGRGVSGLAGLPILRLPVPDNPNPDELNYEAFRGVLNAFVTDLQIAEATLGRIKGNQINLPLNIGLIRLDLNGDGKGSEDEALWRIFKVVAGAGWLDDETAKKLLTDFDSSDVPWLQAYCHLLMAIAEFPLAHDWQEAFEATFPTLFHMPSLPNHKLYQSGIEAFAKRADAKSKKKNRPEPISPKVPEHGMTLSEWLNSAEYKEWERKYDKWAREYSKWKGEIANLDYEYEREAERAGIADLIAFIHLNHWPVIEPERMRRVLEHFESMVRLSRESWKRILAETDKGAEWIPNPGQTGVLPRMEVTTARIAGWQQFLDEFEAILQGEKLIPHWRFEEGINMRRFFLKPQTFDIVLLVQGAAALPYLEKGELTSKQTWDNIRDLFGGNFFRYFIWLN